MTKSKLIKGQQIHIDQGVLNERKNHIGTVLEERPHQQKTNKTHKCNYDLQYRPDTT